MIAKRAKRPGRPPSGPGGQAVSQYPTLTVRIPPATKHRLEALAVLRRQPIWKLIDGAVLAYLDQLPNSERRLVSQFSAHAGRG